MINLSATIKGLITAVAMILLSLAIYYGTNFDNNLQLTVYLVYAAGIVWTLFSHKRSVTEGNKTFKSYFSQGFKCFIVVTLLMVLFTWIFLKMNPSLQEEMAKNYRADLIKNGNLMPAEIDKMVLGAKQFFAVSLASLAVFRYIIVGALVTAIAAVFFSRSEKK